jgi:hypothetical protein
VPHSLVEVGTPCRRRHKRHSAPSRACSALRRRAFPGRTHTVCTAPGSSPPTPLIGRIQHKCHGGRPAWCLLLRRRHEGIHEGRHVGGRTCRTPRSTTVHTTTTTFRPPPCLMRSGKQLMMAPVLSMSSAVVVWTCGTEVLAGPEMSRSPSPFFPLSSLHYPLSPLSPLSSFSPPPPLLSLSLTRALSLSSLPSLSLVPPCLALTCPALDLFLQRQTFIFPSPFFPSLPLQTSIMYPSFPSSPRPGKF